MSVVIKVENLSKKYRLGLINHGMLSKDLQSWWARFRGKEDPNAMLGKGEKSFAPTTDEIYALKDINFEVKQGEVLGIIGSNGAGKSTLLKILSRVTAPTSGSIKIKGRIGSLLEVGTGFHPELTGRENIYLNGAILGMRKWEIDKKLDEIIDFSGVEKFIDTPVKRYSSGMYVRLAFAVAAHLDPEILVIDEVLAVGDADFQKKCLGKMSDISQKDGRTVLFVSHNMTAVKSLCHNCLWFDKGVIKEVGKSGTVIDNYIGHNIKKEIVNSSYRYENAPGNNRVKVKRAYVQCENEKITVKEPFSIITEFWNEEEGYLLNISMHIYDVYGNIVFVTASEPQQVKKGLYSFRLNIPGNFMNDGFYSVNNMFVIDGSSEYTHKNANSFVVVEERASSLWHGRWPGAIRPQLLEKEMKSIAE